MHRKAKNDWWLTGGLLRLVCLGNSLCVGITIMSKSGIIEIIKPVNPLREREGTALKPPKQGCEVTEAFTIAKNECTVTEKHKVLHASYRSKSNGFTPSPLSENFASKKLGKKMPYFMLWLTFIDTPLTIPHVSMLSTIHELCSF